MRTVIFANGEFKPDNTAKEVCRPAGLIIAVDGGIRHCEQLGIAPHVLLGDLDSAPGELVEKAETGKTLLMRFPRDKDKTDLELALDLVVERGTTDLDLFGILGGRQDMSLANILLLAAPGYETLRWTIHDGDTAIILLRGGEERTLNQPPGSRVSLVPVNGPAQGVTLTGFQYPLTDHDLEFGSTLGISNVLLEKPGSITLERGLLLCMVSKSIS